MNPKRQVYKVDGSSQDQVFRTFLRDLAFIMGRGDTIIATSLVKEAPPSYRGYPAGDWWVARIEYECPHEVQL